MTNPHKDSEGKYWIESDQGNILGPFESGREARRAHTNAKPLGTYCDHEGCDFRLNYIEGQWYHVDTHGVAVAHDPEPITYG